MINISNLNKFQDSYQILEINPRFCLWGNCFSRIHKEYLNKFFWPKIFTTNTLSTNVYKIYECDKNQLPYYNVKNFKK
jgi:hypothetical protein